MPRAWLAGEVAMGELRALHVVPRAKHHDEVAHILHHLVEEHAAENDTVEVKKLLFNCIDLTTLKTTDTDVSVMNFIKKVNDFDNDYPDIENVAAICVYPNFTEIVQDRKSTRLTPVTFKSRMPSSA